VASVRVPLRKTVADTLRVCPKLLKKSGICRVDRGWLLRVNTPDRPFMKHPLVAIAVLYAAGVVLGRRVELPLVAGIAVAFATTCLALLLDRFRPLLLPACVFLLGWVNMSTRTATISPHDVRTVLQRDAEIVSIRGRLLEMPTEKIFQRRGTPVSHTLALLEVQHVSRAPGAWEPAFGTVMSRTVGVLGPEFVPGQVVEVSGVAARPEPPIAPGLFDYARYLELRGIYHELKVARPDDWRTYGPLISRPVSVRFREWAQRTLARGIPEHDESLRLQWAMLLGWTTALTAEVSEPFMRSGTMHIFAISGLHIALIAGILVMLLKAASVSALARAPLVIAALWFYTGVTGWQPSAIRATIMMTVILVGSMLRRPHTLLNSVAAAACIILVWQPEQLFQPGFQLSFFVVLSLALLDEPLEWLRGRMFQLDEMLPFELRPLWQRAGIQCARGLWKAFATSLAAFIGSVPLIACYFHLLTPGSLLANIVVVPASAAALASGLGALLVGDLAPFLTELFNHSGWFFMRLMVLLSERAAALPGAWFHVAAPTVAFCVVYYGLLVAIAAGWLMRERARWLVAASAVMLLAVGAAQARRESAWHRLTILPLGDAHAVYAEPADDTPWLINCGNTSAAEFTLKPFLQARGVDAIPNLLLTHGAADFIGGAAFVNDLFPVKAAYVSPAKFRSTPYREVTAGFEFVKRLHLLATNGAIIGPWKVVHPAPEDRSRVAADAPVVLHGTFDGVRVLLLPDVSRAAQKLIHSRHPGLRADIVVAGVSPDDALSLEWLDSLSPRLLVLSLPGRMPPERAAESVQRFRTNSREVVTTESGAVTLAIRNGAWRVLQMREP
jgi:competence protein ComEC